MISVVILTKNSAAHLERCLNVLSRFPEIVVVDNGSTDETMTIAAKYSNVRIHEREFCGFGPLKNTGAELALNDWVLFVDSDEVLHPDLVQYILQLSLDDRKVYQFYRKNYYDNLLIDGCSWDNDYVTRLFNRKITRFNDNQVHESIMTKGLTVEKIKPEAGFIYHFPYANTSQLMAKLEHYANLYAANNYGKKSVKLWMIPLKVIAAFIKNYFIKKGFRYGYEGFLISSYNTMGVLVKYLKLYELTHKQNLAVAITIDEQNIDLDYLIKLLNAQKLLPVQVIFLVDDGILQQQRYEIEQKIREQLIVPVSIIGIDGQDSQLVIKSHLISHPELDGVIQYSTLQLENNKVTYLARNTLHRPNQNNSSDIIINPR